MTTLAPSFLICSSLFLQVTRTTIKSQMGSKLGRIRLGTYDLKLKLQGQIAMFVILYSY